MDSCRDMFANEIHVVIALHCFKVGRKAVKEEEKS
jgi:hypothetical protein